MESTSTTRNCWCCVSRNKKQVLSKFKSSEYSESHKLGSRVFRVVSSAVNAIHFETWITNNNLYNTDDVAKDHHRNRTNIESSTSRQKSTVLMVDIDIESKTVLRHITTVSPVQRCLEWRHQSINRQYFPSTVILLYDDCTNAFTFFYPSNRTRAGSYVCIGYGCRYTRSTWLTHQCKVWHLIDNVRINGWRSAQEMMLFLVA